MGAVVSESACGDTLLPSRNEQVRVFSASAAIDAILRSGGNALIPSFALGRAQEITQILVTAMATGPVQRVPVYLDRLTRPITETYEEMLPLLSRSLENRRKTSGQPVFLSDPVRLVADHRDRARIIEEDRPAVVIASSGMLHAGASPQYARA